jgi:hypothetical protein
MVTAYRIIGALAILAVAGIWVALPAACQSPKEPGSGSKADKVDTAPAQFGRVCWSELEFKASKLLLSATATLSFKEQRGADATPDMHGPPRGKALAVGDKVLLISMFNDLPFGRFEKVSAWLDPASGAALQSEKLVTGSKQYWKLRRYSSDGYYMWRSEPGSKQERKLNEPAWSKRSEYPVKWDQMPPAGTAVSDSYALLYLISAARLDREGASLTTIIYSKKKLVELEFKAGRLLTLPVSYTEVNGKQKRTREGKIRVREVTGRGKPLDGKDSEDNGKDVDLGFLGMQGELTVLLEEGTGIPIEVRGRADTIGKLRVILQKAILAESGT